MTPPYCVKVRAMRALAITLLIACSSKPKATVPAPPATGAEEPPPPVAKPEPKAEPLPPPAAETLAADLPKTTVGGNTFIAPAGWSLVVRGSATILTAPEGDSHVALVDVNAK